MTLDTLAGMIKAGFDDVHEKFDEVHEKFNKVYDRFSELEQKIDSVEATLRVEIGATREEMRQGSVKINQLLNSHEERLAALEHELTP